MQVCFCVVDMDYQNGILKVVRNIANKLAMDEKFEITVLSYMELKGKEKCRFSENIEIKTLGIPSKKKNKWRYFCMIPKLKKFFKDNSYDCCIVSGMEYGISFFLAGIQRKVPIIAWEHLNFFKGSIFRLEWLGKRIALKFFAGILTITKRDQALYLQRNGKAKVFQIYNLVQWEEIQVPYNIKSKKIVSCGFLTEVKGFDMLVQVAKQCLPKHPDWSWDIYGEGVEKENLQNLIKESQLDKQIFLKGYCDRMNEQYSQYSFFVLTSRLEGMGMVMIEAQKAGLPVVAFDVLCGPSDIIKDGVNGNLIPPFNIQIMADRIEDLMIHEDKRMLYSQQSKICHEELDSKIIIFRWKQMLKSIVEGNINKDE